MIGVASDLLRLTAGQVRHCNAGDEINSEGKPGNAFGSFRCGVRWRLGGNVLRALEQGDEIRRRR